jgi:hypothetical protein
MISTTKQYTLQLLTVAILAVGGWPAKAALTDFIPSRVNVVEEKNSLGHDIQNVPDHATGKPPTKTRIGLGDPPHENFLGEPAFAEAFSAFDAATKESTYWVDINANNRRTNDNGTGAALVQLFYRFRKDSPSSTFTLNLTGGLLQIRDGGVRFPLNARVDLTADVGDENGTFSKFEGFALVTGKGGQPFEETFDFKSQNLGVTFMNYSEQRSSSFVSGATLQLPAGKLNLDMGNVAVGAEVTVSITLTAEATAPQGEGSARAFFRDPTSLNGDDLLGGSSITFSGLTLLPPAVPEPTTLLLTTSGLITFACIGRRRFRYSERL